MNLQQYRQHIQNRLLNDIKASSKKDQLMQEGSYISTKVAKNMIIPNMDSTPSNYGSSFPKPTKLNYNNQQYGDENVNTSTQKKQTNDKVESKIRQMNKQINPITNEDVKDDENMNDEEILGGKFNFIKTFKKAGNGLAKDLKGVGKTVKDTAMKTVGSLAGKEAGTAIYGQLKSMGSNLTSGLKGMMTEAPEMVAENPELLMAAGMKETKKPKRPRKVSEKEKNRHALVRQLMNKHGCSLAEASAHIKQQGLKY